MALDSGQSDPQPGDETSESVEAQSTTPTPEATIQEPKQPAEIAKNVWGNVGRSNPEASAQTMFWSGIQDELPLDRSMVRWNEHSSALEMENLDLIKDHLIQETISWIHSLNSFVVLRNEKRNENSQFLFIGLETSEGPEARGITFVKNGDA